MICSRREEKTKCLPYPLHRCKKLRYPPALVVYVCKQKRYVYVSMWNNVYHRWITNNFPCKWHRTASTASSCKSSPRKIFHWNSSAERRWKFISERIEEDDCEAERTSLSTAKATSPTQRPQTCTEAATKYYNYTVSETDEEREHRLPTLPNCDETGSGNV